MWTKYFSFIVSKSLNLAKYYKIMDIGSEWSSNQVSGTLYTRGPDPEPHTFDWILNNAPSEAPALPKSTCGERGWLISKYNSDHVGASKFSSQIKTPVSRLLFRNVSFIHVFLFPKSAPDFTDMLKMHSLCIIFCPVFLSFSCLQLSVLNEQRMQCHSVIHHSR